MSLINGDKIQGSADLKNHNVVWTTNINQLITDPVQNYGKGSGKMPKSEYTIMGENMPSLLDSSSMVRLMQQTYFIRYFRP